MVRAKLEVIASEMRERVADSAFMCGYHRKVGRDATRRA